MCAVTFTATGRIKHIFTEGYAVNAAVKFLLDAVMAYSAVDTLQILIVRIFINVSIHMAVNTFHIAMDRSPNDVFFNIQGYFFPAPLFGEIRIRVAHKAIFVIRQQ
jgi:hypothetical protein